MNDVMATVLALIAALSAATGHPVDAGRMPDRPAIVAPAPSSAGATNSSKSSGVEIEGTLASINGNTIIVNGQQVTLDAKTKVGGKLQAGATVQVEGTRQNGTILAKQVDVKKADAKSSITKSDDTGKDDKDVNDKDDKDVNDKDNKDKND